MAASNEWQEYHLTPSGWVQGSCKWDFSGIEEKPIPADRVLTRRYCEHLSSSFSKMDYSVKTTWRIDDQEAIDHLIAEFGKYPVNPDKYRIISD